MMPIYHSVQKHCHACDTALSVGMWFVRPLPWAFCSKECAEDYVNKDGPVPPNSEDKGA